MIGQIRREGQHATMPFRDFYHTIETPCKFSWIHAGPMRWKLTKDGSVTAYLEDVPRANHGTVDKVGGVARQVALQEHRPVHSGVGQSGWRALAGQLARGEVPGAVGAQAAGVVTGGDLLDHSAQHALGVPR
eukprot:scaffold20654_cov19-Prasinocladus_malaysianus.AAC.1